MTGQKLLFFFISLAVVGLVACATGRRQHPVEGNVVGQRPLCTGCHTESAAIFAMLDHTRLFIEAHGAGARLHPRLCVGCHADDFCSRCHAPRTGINPAERHPEKTWSAKTPHRGEYLVRHRIDGRLDPTSCFPCHGNPQSARRCISCHG